MNTDIPTTDKEAWALYPKYRWLYNTGQLLDYQKVEWSPFITNQHLTVLHNFSIDRDVIVHHSVRSDYQPTEGDIYTVDLQGDRITSTAVIVKGEVRWIAMHEKDSGQLTSPIGDIELRISALAILHLSKFTGIITVDTAGNIIVNVRLRALPELADTYGDEWKKKAVRLYSKRQWSK